MSNIFLLDEIFNSIEGEFPKAGVYSTFIRFAKCNYACPWCDTIYKESYSFKEFTYEEIAGLLKKSNALTFTGGEPSLFLSDITNLLDRFIQDEIYLDYVKIETNGSNLKLMKETLNSKYYNTFGLNLKNIFVYSWSPKFYNKKVTETSFKTLYNEFDTQTTYIKLVVDPNLKDILIKFIKIVKQHYGTRGLKRLALMPLSITENGFVTAKSDPQSILLTKELAEKFKCNVTLRFHEILSVR